MGIKDVIELLEQNNFRHECILSLDNFIGHHEGLSLLERYEQHLAGESDLAARLNLIISRVIELFDQTNNTSKYNNHELFNMIIHKLIEFLIKYETAENITDFIKNPAAIIKSFDTKNKNKDDPSYFILRELQLQLPYYAQYKYFIHHVIHLLKDADDIHSIKMKLEHLVALKSKEVFKAATMNSMIDLKIEKEIMQDDNDERSRTCISSDLEILCETVKNLNQNVENEISGLSLLHSLANQKLKKIISRKIENYILNNYSTPSLYSLVKPHRSLLSELSPKANLFLLMKMPDKFKNPTTKIILNSQIEIIHKAHEQGCTYSVNLDRLELPRAAHFEFAFYLGCANLPTVIEVNTSLMQDILLLRSNKVNILISENILSNLLVKLSGIEHPLHCSLVYDDNSTSDSVAVVTRINNILESFGFKCIACKRPIEHLASATRAPTLGFITRKTTDAAKEISGQNYEKCSIM